MLDEDDLLAAYSMAWSALQRDFQARMARGEFHLAGVQTRPERTTEPRPIPGVWAADCRFDFLQDIVFVGDMRFVAVTAAGGPMAEKRQVAGPADAQLAPLLPERVADLDPDTVAALLEAHADHVRRGLRIQLLPPGKASPLALAASMMRHRGLTGALYDTLEAEAEWLAVWLARVAPSYFPTKAKALSNKLGRLYKDLKAGGDGSWEPGDLSDC
jgi:hypothetical protein